MRPAALGTLAIVSIALKTKQLWLLRNIKWAQTGIKETHPANQPASQVNWVELAALINHNHI